MNGLAALKAFAPLFSGANAKREAAFNKNANEAFAFNERTF